MFSGLSLISVKMVWPVQMSEDCIKVINCGKLEIGLSVKSTHFSWGFVYGKQHTTRNMSALSTSAHQSTCPQIQGQCYAVYQPKKYTFGLLQFYQHSTTHLLINAQGSDRRGPEKFKDSSGKAWYLPRFSRTRTTFQGLGAVLTSLPAFSDTVKGISLWQC